MSNRSRLSKRLERQSQKTLLTSIFGIIIVLFVLLKFGIPLLANFSLMISTSKDTADTTTKDKKDFIPTPVLDALPSATNSATITVSGTAFVEQKINLYLNGRLEDKTDVKSDNTFSFANITLSKGENLVQTKAVTKDNRNQESDFSNQYIIIFEQEAPTLTVDSPSDNQSFSKDDNLANVRGKTDSGVKVTVNGFWAIVDGDGNFSYALPLKEGENIIKVIAIDEAGNKTEKEIKVNFSR